MYVERILTPILREAVNAFPAVLLTGPRQSGKTTLLRQVYGDSYAYVTFDDPLERDFALSDPNGFLDQFEGKPLILDEIQYVPALMPYLKMRIDADLLNNAGRLGRWLLTGSQQFELMRNLTESLAGRVAILDLYPLSAREHAPASLSEAIWLGGYPIPALHPARRDLWVRSYVRTYLERDVRQIKTIGDLRAFEQFLGLCASLHGQESRKAGLARDCGISQPTVAAWLGVLEASFVISLLPPYFRNLGKRLIKTPKLYFLDSALVTTLTRQPDGTAALAGPMGGALLEGWVVAEAIKAFAAVGRKPDLYFWRSQDGLEVDLLILAGGRLHLVEIKLTATPTVRHVAPLNRLKTLLGEQAASEGILVCTSTESRSLPGNNRCIPWQEFPGWISNLPGLS
ncbi:ATP-binding protein [uncultured Thiohalocapsa sp.]|uniref:ATP-binding protein n=1 Tax=uncultured Thiohalocapsa sp. TaxID=768990 RepID=UPI0025F2BA9E|nr:ATP-binding protein [uncultured Thiohalocapsa sp.]